MPPSFEETTAAFDADAGRFAVWQDDFAHSSAWYDDPGRQPPRGAQLTALCRRLAFPPRATEILMAHRDSWDLPAVRRLGAHVQWLTEERYTRRDSILLGWPTAPRECPLMYAYAYLGLAAQCLDRQTSRGIAADITEATLWDIGQQVALHERMHGTAGMDKGWWLVHHLADHLFQLGRLQFQLDGSWFEAGPLRADEDTISIHIPESGPLTPAHVDDALARARAFFPEHFPDERAGWFTCMSWMLDPQLGALLPPSSNVLAFQRRFDVVEVFDDLDPSIFAFVFHRPDLDGTDDPDLSVLPQRTTLQRAIIAHYEHGGRLRQTLGVIPVAEG